MLEYVKNKFPEYFLCLIIAASISINVFQGFWVPDNEASDLFTLVVITAAMLLVLYFFFYNRITIILFLMTLALSLIALIVYANYSGVFLNGFDIKPLLFYIISGICTALVFACSKGRFGIIALFLGDILTFFILIVLEYKNYPLGLVISLTALGIMFARKIYLSNSRKFRYKNDASIKFTGILLVFCCISMLASVGVYYGIIHPLNPPAKKLALLSNPDFIKQAEKFGLASPTSLPDDSLEADEQEKVENIVKTKNQNENASDKNKSQENKDANNKNNNPQNNQQVNDKNLKSAANGSKEQKPTPPTTNQDKATPITYFRKIPVLLIVLISIIALIVIAFVVKKQLRKRWYTKLLTLDRKLQVIKFYGYFLRILSVFGYKRKESHTPMEFAKEMENKSIKFSPGDFNKITEIFIQVKYGNQEIAEEDYKLMLDFYDAFINGCREDSGFFKYLLRYMLL